MSATPLLLDSAGRRRSPATMPGYHAGHAPHNKGMRYPADPPSVEEIIAVMRQAGQSVHGLRVRGLIVVLWRGALPGHEDRAPTGGDRNATAGAGRVEQGQGGRRRGVRMGSVG